MYSPVKDGIEKRVKSVLYFEERPRGDLRELVHCFWELRTETTLPEDFRYHVIPDACVNILLNPMDPRVAAITALHTAPKALNLGKRFHYVGIQLLPGAWRGNPEEIIKGLVNKPYEGRLRLVDTSKKLVGLKFSEMNPVLSELVESLIETNLVSPNVVTRRIIKNINAIRTVTDMASIAGLSPRQLQRTIKQMTGFSPHDFLKILRLQQSFRRDYLDLYADQSHFIHSFRKITGYTPAKYVKKFDV